jgi:hypothetical protein
MKSRLLGTVSKLVLGLGLVASANAAFIGRLETSPGSGIFQAYYDDQLDITWTANANINGSNSLAAQLAWATGLTIDGVGGWRLPNMDVNGDDVVVSCPSVTQAACKDDEYGHLFYYGAGTTLGEGVTATNPGPFSNVQFIGASSDPLMSSYWSETDFPPFPVGAWLFNFDDGSQFPLEAEDTLLGNFAWAVHAGDVVPVPAAVWLFVSGLLGLVGVARRKAA